VFGTQGGPLQKKCLAQWVSGVAHIELLSSKTRYVGYFGRYVLGLSTQITREPSSIPGLSYTNN